MGRAITVDRSVSVNSASSLLDSRLPTFGAALATGRGARHNLLVRTRRARNAVERLPHRADPIGEGGYFAQGVVMLKRAAIYPCRWHAPKASQLGQTDCRAWREGKLPVGNST